jgi:ABC-type antimicrobial peptide transport system permease subunit
MRAVGASSGDVAFIFAGEGLLLGLLSWIVAVPLGLFGAQFFVEALGRAIAFPFFYRLSFSGAVAWLVIIVVLSLPARRATRISMRESPADEQARASRP